MHEELSKLVQQEDMILYIHDNAPAHNICKPKIGIHIGTFGEENF